MKIKKISKKNKDTLKITKCKNGGWIISFSNYNEGHSHSDCLFLSSNFNVEGDFEKFKEIK